MVVLGIDSSLRKTGLALVHDGKVTPNRILTDAVSTLAEQREQTRYIVMAVLRFAPKNVDLTVIEAPYVPQAQGAAGDLVERCWLYGMLVDQLMSRGPVARVRPKTRAKYGSGDGNADKRKVREAVRAAYPNLRVRDDNEADAIALAAMGARHLGEPIDGVPSKAQMQAMTAVVWPTTRREL
jgi:Holliday junction resolvasome RuvABC endonuclease subunit